MGRKRIHETPEQIVAARHAAKAKYKNLTVDAEVVEILNAMADQLTAKLGFRPTISQTLRHLIKSLPPS